jgi:hypothetical protein
MPAVAHRQQPVIVTNSTTIPTSMVDSRSSTTIQPAQTASAVANASHASSTPAPVAASKKAKAKKQPDPVDTNKLLEQTITQLERNIAGNREQELEIGE